MNFASAKARSLTRRVALGLALLCLAGTVHADGTGLRYKGRIVYRTTKTSAGSLLVELVEAKDSGEPTDTVLGSIRSDADGRFTLVQTESTDKGVALVVSAVRESADSSGDRRAEGFDIKSHMTRLGVLLHPSALKPNTVLVEHRQPGHSTN